MRLITDSDIDRIFRETGDAPVNPFASMLKTMEKEQPPLAAYLFEADEEELNEDERNLLVNVGVIAWHIIMEIVGCGAVKTDGFIDRRLDRNLDLFEEMAMEEEEPDTFFDTLFSTHNEQPLLMRFLMGLIVDRPEDYQGTIRDEMVPIMMLHVKTVVDCLLLEEEQADVDDEEFDDYSEEDFEETKSTVASLYGDFTKSSFYMLLEHREKQNAEMIVTSFGEMMYSYFLLMPSAWVVKRAAECCVELMPRKINAGADFFSALVPVLVSFMNYAAERGDIPRARDIADHLPGIEEAIRKNAGLH